MVCLEGIALHGVIMNGLLLWVDMERRTTAEDIWKSRAVEHFSPEEIKNGSGKLVVNCYGEDYTKAR